MSYLTITNVNNWLATTKYAVGGVNSDMEANAAATVLGALDNRYDITPWIDSASTPAMAVSIMAMLVAAWEYDRATSEDSSEDTYAARLERRAMLLLGQLADGSTILPGVEPDLSAGGSGPAFFPTDDSTALADFDPLSPDASPMAFSMGQQF